MATNECCFCSEQRFSLNKSINLPGEESIIYQDDNIFITPDLAPLTEGHFLIVTKEHYCCYGNANLSVYNSLEEGKNFLRNSVYKDNQILFFEHGAVVAHSAGSCIDHAHMHALPIDININEHLENCGYILGKKEQAEYETLTTLANNNSPYILYQINQDRPWAYEVQYLPSQFFRSIVSYSLHKNYNWKDQFRLENSKELFYKTLSMFKKNYKM